MAKIIQFWCEDSDMTVLDSDGRLWYDTGPCWEQCKIYPPGCDPDEAETQQPPPGSVM